MPDSTFWLLMLVLAMMAIYAALCVYAAIVEVRTEHREEN